MTLDGLPSTIRFQSPAIVRPERINPFTAPSFHGGFLSSMRGAHPDAKEGKCLLRTGFKFAEFANKMSTQKVRRGIFIPTASRSIRLCSVSAVGICRLQSPSPTQTAWIGRQPPESVFSKIRHHDTMFQIRYEV